ncbi:hypothetical protein BH11BAC3_BH11BAC3_43500 [soil metagenome]
MSRHCINLHLHWRYLSRVRFCVLHRDALLYHVSLLNFSTRRVKYTISSSQKPHSRNLPFGEDKGGATLLINILLIPACMFHFLQVKLCFFTRFLPKLRYNTQQCFFYIHTHRIFFATHKERSTTFQPLK